VASIFGFATQRGLPQVETVGKKQIRVGTFDSRAIAVAAVNSKAHQDALAKVMAEHERAKAANDTNQIAAIRARMNTKQRRQHEQGFSTASVVSLLESVRSKLPDVAQAANVDLIASKWEVAFASDNVETIDVTDQIVKLFTPSERSLRWIQEVRKRQPIPIDDLPEDLD
jgi:hypothetical protein